MKFKNGKELYEYLTKDSKNPPKWKSLTKEAQAVFEKRSEKDIPTKEESKLPALNVWNDWGKNTRPPELEDTWQIRVLLRFDAEVIDALGGAVNFLNSTEDNNNHRFSDEKVASIENWHAGPEDPTQIYKYMILSHGSDDTEVLNEPDADISARVVTVAEPYDDSDDDDYDSYDDSDDYDYDDSDR